MQIANRIQFLGHNDQAYVHRDSIMTYSHNTYYVSVRLFSLITGFQLNCVLEYKYKSNYHHGETTIQARDLSPSL